MDPLVPLVKDNFAIPKHSYVLARVLAATVAESVAVPAGAKRVLLAGTVDFWFNQTTTAAVPAADVTDGTAPVFVPAGNKELREVGTGTTISLVSAYAAIVTAEFFA